MIEYQKLLRQVLKEEKFKSGRTGTGTEMSNSRSDPDSFQPAAEIEIDVPEVDESHEQVLDIGDLIPVLGR